MSNSSIVIELTLRRSKIGGYYLPLIFMVGILANVMNIIIFSRVKLRENVGSLYFICLSRSEILFLLYNCLYRILTLRWSNGSDAAGKISSLCKFRAYGFLLFLDLSRHFLCLISLDRWMKTSSSYSIRQKSFPKYARWFTCLSCIIWMIICIDGPIGYESALNNGCTSMVGAISQLIYIIHTVLFELLIF